MKQRIITYSIVGIIYLIALASIFPLLGNENQVDWFGTLIYQQLLIVGWIVFFLGFLTVGLILHRSRLKIPWPRIFRIFKIALLGTVLIVGYGSIQHTIDYHNWGKKSSEQRNQSGIKKELDMRLTVDSLQRIIDSGLPDASTFFELGLTYRYNGEWEKSIENYQRAIEVDAEKSEYHVALAYSQSILKNYEEAIKHYEIAYALDTTKDWIKSDIERCKKKKESRK